MRFNSKVMNIYFDTNVFHHLFKRYHIEEKDRKILFSAVESGNIVIFPSIINLEEIIAAFGKNEEYGRRKLEDFKKFIDLENLIKAPDILLQEDIVNFSRGLGPTNPFIVENEIISAVRGFLYSSNHREINFIIQQIRQQKELFLRQMEQTKEKVRPVVEEIKHKVKDFKDYWDYAGKFAEDLAQRSGVLKECQNRGIEELLNLRTIRLCIGANLSLIYSYNFENRNPKIGDSRDMLHAVMASPADIFVLQDGRFASIMKRIPIEGFEVINLKELLTRLS
jgi:hypothetical protein